MRKRFGDEPRLGMRASVLTLRSARAPSRPTKGNARARVSKGEENRRPSLPGLTPQVGFTRLAARNIAQLGQARVAMQSIVSKKVLRSMMDHPKSGVPDFGRLKCASRQTRLAWVKPGGDETRLQTRGSS